MKYFSTILAVIFLSGCTVLERIDNALMSLAMEEGPTLDARPTLDSCSTKACRRLDAIEAEGYNRARSGQITWTKFVNVYYSEREKLFPSSSDENRTRELISFHRLLAEQRDAGKISEAQWEYLIDKKYSELDDRASMVANTKPKVTNCTTSKLGDRYSTTCQ